MDNQSMYGVTIAEVRYQRRIRAFLIDVDSVMAFTRPDIGTLLLTGLGSQVAQGGRYGFLPKGSDNATALLSLSELRQVG